MPLLFPNPARSGLPSYQTVAEPWHGCAVTRARIDHLRANLFNARLLTRSTLLRRQCHVVGFRVTGALDLVLGVESRFAVTRQVTRGWQTLKFDRDKPLILLVRPKRFELLTPRFVVSGGQCPTCHRPADGRLSPGRLRLTDKSWASGTPVRGARIRRHQLLEHPLCRYCAERGIVTPATICDHVEPHRGDVNKFWLGRFQSLCKSCHDSTKRFVETRGFRPDIGLDGWPLDPRHPVYPRLGHRKSTVCYAAQGDTSIL